MSTSTLQFYIDMATAEGLRVDKTEQSRHYKLYVSNARGQSTVISASRSLSDSQRGNLNMRARMRRFARSGHL